MQVRPRAAVQNIFRDLYFHVLWRKVRINRLGDVLTLQVCVLASAVAISPPGTRLRDLVPRRNSRVGGCARPSGPPADRHRLARGARTGKWGPCTARVAGIPAGATRHHRAV